jgi:hypothetical protein
MTLGSGIAVQDRMAFQGEYFVDRYGEKQAKRTPSQIAPQVREQVQKVRAAAREQR